jgi:hypothetical protein
VFSHPDGQEGFGVSLVGARHQEAFALDGATVVHPDSFDATDVVFQTSAVGAARTLMVLTGPSAPTEFRFEFAPLCLGTADQSPSSIRLRPTGRGAVQIELATGPEAHGLGMIGAPWAVDAAGTSLPTSFEVRGSTLVQHVDTGGALFPVTADPTYFYRPCNGYVSDSDARGYILSGHCPVPAIFHSIRPYDGVWAYEANVYNDYGLVVVRQDGQCSPPALKTGPYWDFELPCLAHDYCWDLIRAGFGGVTKGDCDRLFLDLMVAHCNDRVLAFDCEALAYVYYSGVQLAGVGPHPPRNYALVAQHSGKCADVANASFDHGAQLTQWTCHYGSNQQFQIEYTGVQPVDYALKANHSGKCAAVWDYGAAMEVRQGICEPQSNHFLWWVRGFGSVNQYTFRPRSSGWSSCMDVPYSSGANGVGLIHYSCHETSNQRWAIVHVS